MTGPLPLSRADLQAQVVRLTADLEAKDAALYDAAIAICRLSGNYTAADALVANRSTSEVLPDGR